MFRHVMLESKDALISLVCALKGISQSNVKDHVKRHVKNRQPYSTDFCINVLQLNHIDKATLEDIDNNLVYWAKLFKAKT